MSRTIRISNGDYFIDENVGKTIYVEGPWKMAQDLIEEFLTPYNAIRNIGTKIRELDNINLIRQEIAETVDRLKNRQKLNPALSPREQIDEITKLIVKTYDGTDVVFLVEVSSVAKDKEQITMIIQQGYDPVQVDQQFL